MGQDTGPSVIRATSSHSTRAHTGHVAWAVPKGMPMRRPIFPVGLRNTQGDDKRRAGELEISDVERHRLGTAAGAGEAEEQHDPIPESNQWPVVLTARFLSRRAGQGLARLRDADGAAHANVHAMHQARGGWRR